MKPIIILASLLITGCVTGTEGCRLPAYGLNGDHWHPAATDLKPCVARRASR